MRVARRARAALTVLAVLAAAFLVLAPGRAEAQGGRHTTLTITGFPLSVVSTDGAVFEAGAVPLGSTSFTVAATRNQPNFSPRVTTVQIQCSGACPRSGTLALSGLQWRRDDQATWTTLTATYTTVETRTLTVGGANDPWGRTLLWRYLLDWTANPPTPTTQYFVRLQLLVAQP